METSGKCWKPVPLIPEDLIGNLSNRFWTPFQLIDVQKTYGPVIAGDFTASSSVFIRLHPSSQPSSSSLHPKVALTGPISRHAARSFRVADTSGDCTSHSSTLTPGDSSFSNASQGSSGSAEQERQRDPRRDRPFSSVPMCKAKGGSALKTLGF